MQAFGRTAFLSSCRSVQQRRLAAAQPSTQPQHRREERQKCVPAAELAAKMETMRETSGGAIGVGGTADYCEKLRRHLYLLPVHHEAEL